VNLVVFDEGVSQVQLNLEDLGSQLFPFPIDRCVIVCGQYVFFHSVHRGKNNSRIAMAFLPYTLRNCGD